MIDNNTKDEIIKKIELRLNIKIVSISLPQQGLDSFVFFVKNSKGVEYAIKYGLSSASDPLALDLLKKNKITVPTPKILDSFNFKNIPLLVLEKIGNPLLKDIPANQIHRYIPDMIKNLKKIHKLKSSNAGILTNTDKISWKGYLLSKFSGEDPSLDWLKISKKEGLDEILVLNSVKSILKKIENAKFIKDGYSFLHTDFNQRNLFVDPNSDKVASIIDWSEAVFGDPIYDFARIKMLIWHLDLGKTALNNYNDLLKFNAQDKALEELYMLIRIIEYLAYYSDELNKFNINRIKLHQDFLRKYKWKN